MPFRIAKSFTVESGHLLTKSTTGCRFPHGHSRTIEVIVASDHLDAADMVCDFQTLKTAAAQTVAHYDHAFALNTADPNFGELRATYGERVIAFAGVDPTTEALAREIFRAIRTRLAELAPAVRLERIRVTETATSWAEYWE
ncbi:MAG TPA: 6-carboxytetrahydropterin synthase [Opitutus sp.]|nr:6-carboxytetrahydropterin synthase [Opitutus sp.]